MKNGDIVRNVLIDLLIVGLIAALVFFYMTNIRSETDRLAYDRDKAQEADEIAKLKREQGSDILNELLSALEVTTEGIVFWGDDSLTAGRGSSLPEQLSRQIDDAVFSSIASDFSTIARVRDVSRLTIPVYNMGVSDEGMGEIMVRCGAWGLQLAESFDLPAEVIAHDVELQDTFGRPLRFARQKSVKFGRTTIQGVSGDLYTGSEAYDSQHIRLAFARSEAGEARTFPAGTALQTEAAEQYRSCAMVLFFHEPEDMDDGTFVECLKQMLDRQTGDAQRYAVVCTTEAGTALDLALKQAFGDHYVRNEKAADDMRITDNIQLARLVYAVLDQYGLFDDARASIQVAHEALERVDAIKAD